MEEQWMERGGARDFFPYCLCISDSSALEWLLSFYGDAGASEHALVDNHSLTMIGKEVDIGEPNEPEWNINPNNMTGGPHDLELIGSAVVQTKREVQVCNL